MPTPQTKKDIETYGSFVVSSVAQSPKLSDLLSQRSIRNTQFAEVLKTGDYPCALAISLKLLSDWIVLEKQVDTTDDSFLLSVVKEPMRSKTPTMTFEDPPHKDDYLQMIEDSEKLLATISAHSDRINALNRQISETMTSSYQLLSQRSDQRSPTLKQSHKRRSSGPAPQRY